MCRVLSIRMPECSPPKVIQVDVVVERVFSAHTSCCCPYCGNAHTTTRAGSTFCHPMLRILLSITLVVTASAATPVPSSKPLSALGTVRQIRRPGARGHRTEYPTTAPRAALREVTDSSVWPKPVSEIHGAGVSFFQVGSDGYAAVDADCPFLAHGDGSSLAACEHSCASDSTCNCINWNPAIGDCVLRACVNPTSPELEPTPGYSAFATVRGYYGIDPDSFAFLVVGEASHVLSAAIARYRTLAFPYPAAAIGHRLREGRPQSSGLLVNVTPADTVLRLGVNESYTLSVVADASNGEPLSVLTAATAYGALRGLETFSQLVQYNLTDSTYLVQDTTITDAPRFPFRGVLLDTARRYFPVSVLKAAVDAMAAVKLNVLVSLGSRVARL